MFGEWRSRAERAAEFDAEEERAARSLAELEAAQWARADTDQEG
jgi:hypothetical protein